MLPALLLTLSLLAFILSDDFGLCDAFRIRPERRIMQCSRRLALSRPVASSPRIQKLKEVTLHKSIVKDITSCEFALRVEASHTNRDQIIDFDRLAAKLDQDLVLLQKSGSKDESGLVSRILKIKEDMNLAARDMPLKHTAFIEVGPALEATPPPPEPEQAKSSTSIQELKENVRIRIREDGSVDWDGAVASGKEIAKFGVELWERLNGKDEGIPTFAELFGQAQEKDPQSPEIARLATALGVVEEHVVRLVREREGMKAEFRRARREGAEVSKTELLALKALDSLVQQENLRRRVLALNLDMEKVCTCLQREVEGAADLAEYRALIAEVTLLDRQLWGLVGGAWDAESTALAADPSGVSAGGLGGQEGEEAWWRLVDEDELKLVGSAVQDLKNRLGLDAQQLMRPMDWGSLGEAVKGGLAKVRAGIAFFKDGTALLGADIQYAWMLVRRAAQGYTLKPREVNALRRTGRDMLTLVPFTIILLIPMTPVGHVLVFSFIQRYFPEFFPSCYTEKRLNLKRLFSEVERRQ